MATNPHWTPSTDDTVVGTIDPDPASADDEYVIADISTDGAWLSMQAAEAPALSAWR